MPKLIRFIIINSTIGILLGWAICAAMLYLNVSGIGELFMRSQQKMTVLVILALSFGVTFGFGYLTTAIMLLPTDKDEFEKL